METSTPSGSWLGDAIQAARHLTENSWSLPSPNKYSKNRALGTWVSNQRQDYLKSGILAQDRIDRLNAIGLCGTHLDGHSRALSTVQNSTTNV